MVKMEEAGIEFHTFTIIARCEHTQMLGLAMATSSPCAGVRCPLIQTGLGALSVQAVSNPRMRMLAMKLLEMGHPAQGVLKSLENSDPFIEYRQIGVVDADGRVAVRTGQKNIPWAGHFEGKGYLVMGNALSGEQVIRTMADSFEKSKERSFDERLLSAIEAGRDAGGQPEGQTSAALLVYDRQPYPYLDLRVDVHEEPVRELRRIFDWFNPLIPYYNMRSVEPRVPRYKDWLRQQGISR